MFIVKWLESHLDRSIGLGTHYVDKFWFAGKRGTEYRRRLIARKRNKDQTKVVLRRLIPKIESSVMGDLVNYMQIFRKNRPQNVVWCQPDQVSSESDVHLIHCVQILGRYVVAGQVIVPEWIYGLGDLFDPGRLTTDLDKTAGSVGWRCNGISPPSFAVNR